MVSSFCCSSSRDASVEIEAAHATLVSGHVSMYRSTAFHVVETCRFRLAALRRLDSIRFAPHFAAHHAQFASIAVQLRRFSVTFHEFHRYEIFSQGIPLQDIGE